jgi:transcription elongation factor Elf1
VDATELTEVKPATRTEKPLTAEALWQQVMTYAGHSRIARTKLECLNVHSLEGNTLRLYINEEGASSARLLRKSMDEITSLICTACGRTLEVQLDEPSHGLNVASASSESDIAMAEQLPLVSEAMDIFDARIIHVSDE